MARRWRLGQLLYLGQHRGSIDCRTAQDFAPTGVQEAKEALLPARRELCGSLHARRLPDQIIASVLQTASLLFLQLYFGSRCVQIDSPVAVKGA